MNILEVYLQNQHEVVFSEVLEKDDFWLISCGLPSRFYLWNFTLSNGDLKENQIDYSEKIWYGKKLRSSFCFELNSETENLEKKLIQRNYEKKAHDEWLIFDFKNKKTLNIKKQIERDENEFPISSFKFQDNFKYQNDLISKAEKTAQISIFKKHQTLKKLKTKNHQLKTNHNQIVIQKVDNEALLEKFLDVFYLGFNLEIDLSKPGEDFYYGYLKRAWYKNKADQFGLAKKNISNSKNKNQKNFIDKSKSFENYLLYFGKIPVACVSMTYFDGKSYLSDLACLKEFRGRGLGKTLVHFCLEQSFVRGDEFCFLKTEKAEGVASFYLGLGFEKISESVYYVKGELEKTFWENNCLFLRPARNQ